MTVIITDSATAYMHLEMGIDYLKQNMFHEAIYEFDQVIALNPTDKYAHWNKAMALLSLGEYEEGFREHDCGWRLFDWRGFGPVRGDIDRLRLLPVWDGEEIRDESLLVYHELGFGDAIQTMRYLPELKRRAGHVTLVINRELRRLAEQFDVEIVESVPQNLNVYAYRLPFFGVMMALRQTVKNIPNDPYIFAEGGHGCIECGYGPCSDWPNCKSKRVGICWAGRTNKFSLKFFLEHFEHVEYDLYSLQCGPVDGEKVHPLDTVDFYDTAEVIARMEHVITIDSAVAHLAGAMGHPSTHLLLPYQGDWRWWCCGAWYPTIKTYRQDNVWNWSGPFARLNEALHQ